MLTGIRSGFMIPFMSKTFREDPVMSAVRDRFERSGMTQQQLGERMGYAATTARQSVSQFLRSGDPQIGRLRRFCDAMGITLRTLLDG